MSASLKHFCRMLSRYFSGSSTDLNLRYWIKRSLELIPATERERENRHFSLLSLSQSEREKTPAKMPKSFENKRNRKSKKTGLGEDFLMHPVLSQLHLSHYSVLAQSFNVHADRSLINLPASLFFRKRSLHRKSISGCSWSP